MYLACISVLRYRGMFLVILSDSGDFAARMNVFRLLYRYGSAGNLYGSIFSDARYGLVSGYGELHPEYCFRGPA